MDLDIGLTFADLPAGFGHDLLDEVTARISAAGGPALLLLAPGVGSWTVTGPQRPTSVVGPLPDLTRWVTGRGDRRSVPVAHSAERAEDVEVAPRLAFRGTR